MFPHNLRLAPIAALLLAAASAAQAGSVSDADVKSTILIQDESSGAWWSLDVSPVVTVDAATGDISVDASLLNQAQVTSNVAGDTGQWSTSVVNGETVLSWHSMTRATTGGPWATSVTLGYGGNVDPELNYALRVKNNGTTDKLVTFVQEGDIEPPVAGAYNVTSQVSGVLTNGSTAGSIRITPNQPDADADLIAELQILELSSDGGATYVNAGVDVGQAANVNAAANQLATYGNYIDTKAGYGSFNYWRLTTKFKLSGGGDQADLTGSAEITAAAIPEPGRYAMLVAGLGAVGFVARRRSA